MVSYLQWQSSSISFYFLVYRWLIAAFFAGCVAVSIIPLINHNKTGCYFIFMTDWALLACLMTALYGAVLVTLWTFRTEYSGKYICKSIDTIWLNYFHILVNSLTCRWFEKRPRHDAYVPEDVLGVSQHDHCSVFYGIYQLLGKLQNR